MRETYRSGAIGALMDKYERAASDLARLIERVPKMISAGLDSRRRMRTAVRCKPSCPTWSGPAQLRRLHQEQFAIASSRPQPRLLSQQESLEQLDAALRYTIQTLEGRWEMSDEEITGVINSRWGVVYNVEGLMEHAVVHILRHRRQIEKFIWRGLISAPPGV